MLTTLTDLWKNEEGQGMTEYALILALIAVGLIAVLVLFKGKLIQVFTSAQTSLDTAQQ